jgi:glycogen synthase
MLAGKESMKVLFWSETFWPRVGGVENLAARLLPALRTRGYEFAVVTWEDIDSSDQILYGDIPVYRFPFFPPNVKGNLDPIMEHRRQVAQLKRRFAPDVVHINSSGRSVLFHVNTANAHHAPVLMTLHQPLSEKPVQRDSLLHRLLRTSDWVNACSDAVLIHAQQLVPEIIPHSSVIHNAVKAPELDPQPLSFNPPRLLCVGRLVAEKGFDSALTAFATVLDRFPSARLVIAGDGPERQRLTKQMTDLGLINSVEFVGSIPPETVPHLMNKATLVLIPSRLEGFGLVALEAALMARPVVATHVGGLSEVVLHQKTGFLVEQEDEEGLANAILFLLSNPQTASAFGDAARQRAQEVFSFERYVNAHDDLYESLIRKVPRVDDARL